MKYWFIFCQDELLLQNTDGDIKTIPMSEECPVKVKEWNTIHNITPMADGTEVKTVCLDTPVTEDIITDEKLREKGFTMCPLRQSYYSLPYDLYLKAGKCREIIYWDKNTKFCGVCGAPMRLETDISKRCTGCGKELWPSLATAVIVLIHRGDDVLLVRARNFRSDFYGLVAGFVETGETLEEAVHREVLEEVGLKITNLKYFGSQPWPYPCGLMVGFNADYVSGDIKLQKEEIAKGDWFNRNNLPKIPEKLSIARKLIDNWLSPLAPEGGTFK